ncbi:MAG TPA: sigma-70 family RNA polymerase sigma factor [Stellaceae bacterium]|jgi:RNA polymerase sigma-70 factor (ECF subfamily)|nr:sigma-70 family RNA polymerase sigma factor [Stellaceae bacterium]
MLATFPDDVVHYIPRLEKFAWRLARNRSDALDLVQETVLRALLHADQFLPGTNLSAWLNTILRNYFFNERRLRLRVVPVDPASFAGTAAIKGDQEAHAQMCSVSRHFAGLPAAHREALMLVGASGYSYETAAKIAGCPVGTMKSRVSRARIELRSATES